MAPTTPAPLPQRLSFERRILLGALLVALPALLGFASMVYLRGGGSLEWSLVGLVALMTLILALRLRRDVVYPLYTLSNLLEALREGDYSLRGARARRGDAIGEVIWEVNALAATLREQRLQVEEKSALLAKVIATIDMAILAFDAQRRLKLVNPAAERLLARPSRELLGRSAEELALVDCLDSAEAQTVARSFAGGSGRFEVRRATFREGGLPHDLLVISDLSRALREEERLAWQRLLRVLGHELNNSLAPIRSMAGTLSKLLGADPLPEDWREDASGGLRVIGERSESLSRFMTRYTALARLPPPSPRQVALAPLLERVARLEQRLGVALERGPEVTLEADPDQLEQALINLVKNAADAALTTGGGVALRWQADPTSVVVDVLDEGPGLPPTENLFVPFFTTKPGGSGIGLVLSRQIVEAHGGSLRLTDRTDRRGCVARVTLAR